MTASEGYDGAALPDGVRRRTLAVPGGLRVHLLESGFEPPRQPALLLLHGFPELAWSWRAVMPALAAAGHHVIAPDQRGYGRTTGWLGDYEGELRPFHILNLVRDQVALLAALDAAPLRCVVGHDFGARVAAWAALVRPDLFPAVVLMSAPFAGPPPLDPATDTATPARAASMAGIDAELARLDPPRKHYHHYYATRAADADMRRCPQGIHAFLRAYFHVKSADWPQNRPRPLAAWRAEVLATLPNYYVMERARTMAETVAPHMPGPEAVAACEWLPEPALAVYAGEFARTGFQGGLQWYRAGIEPGLEAELQLYAGRRIEVPAAFLSGASDWGVYQRPGDLERMRTRACSDMRMCELVDGAGHWVQQEQPAALVTRMLDFLGGLR